MRAGEMSMAERIVRKIRREPFTGEENDLFLRKKCDRPDWLRIQQLHFTHDLYSMTIFLRAHT